MVWRNASSKSQRLMPCGEAFVAVVGRCVDSIADGKPHMGWWRT
jgi:hypothetical protein